MLGMLKCNKVFNRLTQINFCGMYARQKLKKSYFTFIIKPDQTARDISFCTKNSDQFFTNMHQNKVDVRD